jgi:hypothetical protein
MGVAVKFDDNGELDVFQFDTRCEFVDTATPQAGDYDQFIRKNNMAPRGGTAYTPIVENALDFYFGGPEPERDGGTREEERLHGQAVRRRLIGRRRYQPPA